MIEDLFNVSKGNSIDVVFDHKKYILSGLQCVWQTEVDYSLYILDDLCVQ